MSKKIININDFDLLVDVMKTSAKIVDAAKLIISSRGLEIYGVRSTIARCEIVTNAIFSDEEFTVSIQDLSMLNKILHTIKDVHESDYSNLVFSYDQPFLKFESKKIKTKYGTVNESIISQWVSDKIKTQLTSVFDFTTTSDLIKKMNSYSFMFKDSKSIKIYLETKDDMEANTVYATLGNRQIENSNEMVMKTGLVTFGEIPETRSIILDFERLNLFNAIQSNNIVISLMNQNVLMSKTHINGKNNSQFDLSIYNTILKN